MAMPMIAGPGSIATMMLLMSRSQGTEQTLVVLAALVAVLVLTLLALIAAGPLMKLLGASVEAVITRLLGVLLAALGAFLEHHVERDQEQHDPARDAKAVEFDVQPGQQLFAEQRENQQDDAGDERRADRHAPRLRPARTRGQPGIDRRAAGRIDHHEQRDEGGEEQLEHRLLPGRDLLDHNRRGLSIDGHFG